MSTRFYITNDRNLQRHKEGVITQKEVDYWKGRKNFLF